MVENLITIYDRSATNALFDGDEQSVFVYSYSLNGANTVSANVKTHQPLFATSDGVEEATKYINAFNRKKTEAQYTSFNVNQLTLTIVFKWNEKDITQRIVNGETVNVLNISKLMHFIRTPKTYYVKDPYILPQLATDDINYYEETGFPVVIKTWSITPNTRNGDISVVLGLQEDFDTLI